MFLETRDEHFITIVGWNIRAGGGVRAPWIAERIASWRADVVALSEFRGTPASVWLRERLASDGLAHQADTVDPMDPARNRMFIASRWPIETLALAKKPRPDGKWLPVRVAAPRPFVVSALHAPLFVSGKKHRWRYTVLDLAKRWRHGPALFIGDTNTGKMDIDEESRVFSGDDDAWFDAMARAGWRDAFRTLNPDTRWYTWYSPNKGNGFRLDEAFVNDALWDRLAAARYEWAMVEGSTRRDAVSDHAAVIVELRH
ncbi:MAG: hypothetical protein FJ318_05700 [SAR202 cluster bacterium]|nr:hypothetical protein [SAR202 cluster bacterium]